MTMPDSNLPIDGVSFATDYSDRVTHASISLTTRRPVRYYGRELDTSYCDITIQIDDRPPVHAVSGQDRTSLFETITDLIEKELGNAK